MRPGFTLVEPLVSLIVLGIIAVMMAREFRVSTRVWDRERMATAEAGDDALVRAFLAARLSAAYPRYDKDGGDKDARDKEGGHPHVAFDGDRHALQFLAAAPRSLSGGLARYGLALIADDHGTFRLELSADYELAADDRGHPVSPLLSHIEAAEFGYFGSVDGQPRDWHTAWHEQRHLPELIRLHLAFAGQPNRVWPDLLVAPMIAADVQCVYDAAIKGCQGR